MWRETQANFLLACQLRTKREDDGTNENIVDITALLSYTLLTQHGDMLCLWAGQGQESLSENSVEDENKTM